MAYRLGGDCSVLLSYEGGLLHIDLVRELPETMKPRKVEICTKGGSLLEGKAEKAA